jgi:hypothetical protein
METESDKRLDRLFAAARADAATASIREEHFETRLMARIRDRRSEQQPWYALAWRMLPAYAGVVAIIAVCSATFNPASSSDIFASLTGGQDDSISISFLAGE